MSEAPLECGASMSDQESGASAMNAWPSSPAVWGRLWQHFLFVHVELGLDLDPNLTPDLNSSSLAPVKLLLNFWG